MLLKSIFLILGARISKFIDKLKINTNIFISYT